MTTKPILTSLLYKLRDFRSRDLYKYIKKYCHGKVLDVGGGNFFIEAKQRKIRFKSWTNLEPSDCLKSIITDKKYNLVLGDGCKMPFKSNFFDTVLNIQVLEHVFEPLKMVSEISRVLKPGGYAIFLIPQTSTLHMAPNHYYNFTKYWIFKAMKMANFKIVKYQPLGGVWSSMASHLIYFFLQSVRYEGSSDKTIKRNVAFYFLFPLMCFYALISIPISLFFSIGDLSEEPNNHLIIAQKYNEQSNR